MRTITSALAVGLLVAGIVPATALAGGAPVAASGTWDDCNTNAQVRASGPNLIVTVDIIESYHGTLDGEYIGTERDVVYADGTATFNGDGTFSGSVDGLTGTGRLRYEGAVGTSGVMPATGPTARLGARRRERTTRLGRRSRNLGSGAPGVLRRVVPRRLRRGHLRWRLQRAGDHAVVAPPATPYPRAPGTMPGAL